MPIDDLRQSPAFPSTKMTTTSPHILIRASTPPDFLSVCTTTSKLEAYIGVGEQHSKYISWSPVLTATAKVLCGSSFVVCIYYHRKINLIAGHGELQTPRGLTCCSPYHLHFFHANPTRLLPVALKNLIIIDIPHLVLQS